MTWRVWMRDWVPVYTSDKDGDAGREECEDRYQEQYKGRVTEAEWRVEDWGPRWPALLSLQLPVMQAEFTDEDQARVHLTRVQFACPGRTTWVAELGSELDKNLESYGKRKLPE